VISSAQMKLLNLKLWPFIAHNINGSIYMDETVKTETLTVYSS
jgi:hypothetical protein